MRVLAIILCFSLTGCGMVLGVKEIKTAGGTVIKFNSGFGFEASASGSDTLNNNRSIKP